MAARKERIWSRASTSKSKGYIKRCVLCGGLFYTKSEKRKYCSPHHRVMWCEYCYLLRKQKANKLADWEIGLLKRLENFIAKEKSKNEEPAGVQQAHGGGEVS